MAAADAHPVRHRPRWHGPVVQRDDPRVVDHLEIDHHIARPLHDLDAVVVAERQHRGGEAAGDAAVPAVEIRHPVIGLAPDPARPAGRVQARAFLGQRRQAAIHGIDQQRGAPAGAGHFDPVAHAQLAGLGFLGGRPAGILHPVTDHLVLGVGQPHAPAHGRRPLQRQAADDVDRPHAAQVRVAPGRLLGRVLMRHGRQDVELGMLGAQRRLVLRRQSHPHALGRRPARCGRRGAWLGAGRRQADGEPGCSREQSDLAHVSHQFPQLPVFPETAQTPAISPGEDEAVDSAMIVTVKHASREPPPQVVRSRL